MKAQRLGDTETQDDESFDPFRRRGGRFGLGGAAARASRAAKSTGAAAAGLGGPVPTSVVFGVGGRPRLFVLEERMERD